MPDPFNTMNAISTGAGILSSGIGGGSGKTSRAKAERAIKSYGGAAASELSPFMKQGRNAMFQFKDRLKNQQPGLYDEFQGGDRVGGFDFNVGTTPGYRFARDEALKATERGMAARGMNQSGNVLAELQRRASGLAGQHTNDAFARQLQAFQANQGADQINYGRDVNEFGMDAARNQDEYGRFQNALANWKGLADMGQNAATNRANIFTGIGANYANIRAGAGAADQQRNQFQASAINNAIQGGMQNHLLSQYLNQQQPTTFNTPWGGR